MPAADGLKYSLAAQLICISGLPVQFHLPTTQEQVHHLVSLVIQYIPPLTVRDCWLQHIISGYVESPLWLHSLEKL